MNRDQRKISRSLEERNILASTTRVSQISQTDNELKQKLEAIDTSYKLSNKRISNETRELRGILHSLQKELKVSKGARGEYIPSIFDQRQARCRRFTVSSVPSEDRKEVGVEKSQQRYSKGENTMETQGEEAAVSLLLLKRTMQRRSKMLVQMMLMYATRSYKRKKTMFLRSKRAMKGMSFHTRKQKARKRRKLCLILMLIGIIPKREIERNF